MGFFENKIVLITGGTSGIGFHIASRFSTLKSRVLITGRDFEKGKKALSKIKSGYSGSMVEFLKSDNGDKQDIISLYDYIISEYKTIDIAVNNASIIQMGKLLDEYTIDEYNKIMDVNLTGVFLSVQNQVRIMKKKEKGSIINVASNVGVRANSYGISPYIISKHGVIGLTRVAALEYAAYGIRVNAVLPGITDTDMLNDNVPDELKSSMIQNNPMKRLVSPDEIAAAVIFLASDTSSAINGVALPVDGGKMVKS